MGALLLFLAVVFHGGVLELWRRARYRQALLVWVGGVAAFGGAFWLLDYLSLPR